MPEPKPLYAWFSSRAAKQFGTGFWSYQGKRVEVTTVHETLDHGSGWPDLVYVGQVDKWLSIGREASQPSLASPPQMLRFEDDPFTRLHRYR